MSFNRGSVDPAEPMGGLLLDDDGLAHRARTSLAAAEEGRLIFGPPARGRAYSYRVGVLDDDGEPRLICRPGGAVELAAAEGRTVTLAVEPTEPAALRLRLSGRLTAVDEIGWASGRTQPPPTAHAAVVWLRVEHVMVGCPHPSAARRAPRERELSLHSYALAEPDEFVAQLPRLLGHVNRHHTERMRDIAARQADVPPADILAAALTGLDAHGARVTWIGADGAHDVVVRFAEPVATVEELTLAVRTYLGSARRVRPGRPPE